MFLQEFQNVLSNRMATYQMATGTLSVVISDQVFFAAGYHGNKVSNILSNIVVSLKCLCLNIYFFVCTGSNYSFDTCICNCRTC